MTVTVGSLFSGIGGMDLGLERAGFKVIWNSEIDPYCCRVLKKWWPDVPNLGDVTKVDWSTVERPDVICGGYPCQPFSQAGHRRGGVDGRHLWPYMRPRDSRGPDRIEPCPACEEDWCHWHAQHRYDCGCVDPWDESDDPDFGWWATEPNVGRVADGVPSRVDRLRGLGNAVVPQVAEYIGHQLMAVL